MDDTRRKNAMVRQQREQEKRATVEALERVVRDESSSRQMIENALRLLVAYRMG